jgi:beta-lactamase class A
VTRALERELAELCNGFSGVAGVAAERLEDGAKLEIRAAETFPTASAIKIFVLYQLFVEAAAGRVDLAERIELASEQKVNGSGVLSHLAPGLAPTLGDLAILMMMLSDNTATNLLIFRLGADAINRAIGALGLRRTRLGGSVDFAALAADKSALGVATPGELARFLARLGKGELFAPPWTERMLDVLRIQKYIEPLRRELPADPYAREFGDAEPVWVASKTGSLSGVRVEAGLVTTPNARWSIAVMTKHGADARVTSDNEGVRLIARVSRLVYDAWR